jgi:hypothetical protein
MQVFHSLDRDGDGKLTEVELRDGIRLLSAAAGKAAPPSFRNFPASINSWLGVEAFSLYYLLPY